MCRSRAQSVIDENEPSVAGNSRSTNERQDCDRKEDEMKIRVSGKHGWNFYELGTVLLFLIAFSLLCGSSRADPEPCAVTIEGTHNCPFTKEQALFVEYGHPITMFCYREWSSEKRPFSRDRQVSDFIILLNNEIVQPLTDFGPDEVQLPLETLPPSTNTFECRLKIPNDTRGDTELIYRSTITIGFKPKRPRSFKCVSHNLEKLVCTWDPEPNTIPTRFSLRESDTKAFLCPAPQAGSKIPPNSCVWDTSMYPPYNPKETIHAFLLDGENILGKNSFKCFDFSYWENAIPPQPDNLLVLNTTDSSALLRWSVSGSGRVFMIPGLHHRVSYQAQSDSQKTWLHTANIRSEYGETEILFLLTNLEFADTVYNVRVSMKSSYAVDEDKWSQPAETIFKTAVSRQGPYTVTYDRQKQFAADAFRPPKPKTVGVDRIGSESVEVKWELPYSGRIDIVKGFNVYYCPALPSQQCTGPTMKTFVTGDQHLTVGTVRDLKPDTTYKVTVAVLSENGEEGLHSAPSYFTTTKAEPDVSLIEKTIRVAIEQSSSGIKDYVKDLMEQYKQNEMDELRSQINDSVVQVSNLGLTITALNAKLDSLSESTKQRDEALDHKLDGIDELKSKITESATQVSNLTRPIIAFDAKLDSLSDSFKQRDKALDDKLGGIDELNARINDSVTEVSNLGQTISAYKVELVSLSEENCQVRDNLTRCERDLADSFGKPPNW